MARKSAPARQNFPADPRTTLAPTPRLDDTQLPVTESERVLFATCFGTLIDQILAEPD